jgi:predicted GNAT family acetyltransferase
LRLRVQSYSEISSWKNKALPYLRKEEGWNNLFWQIIDTKERTSCRQWAGNVFEQGEVFLSALHTPSNYLLLSHGSSNAVHTMSKYSLDKKWELAGLCGPETVVNSYLEYQGKKGPQSPCSSQRVFKLFQTSNHNENPRFEDYKLVPVSKIDWPKARIWAQQFAMEADPPLDISAITQLAKQMYSTHNLFVLTDPQNHPCAMAGFGRSTERYRVINMVYVPTQMRRQGIGRELVTRMAVHAKELGYHNCLLFSEWLEVGNLYDAMGCKLLGTFVEYELV